MARTTAYFHDCSRAHGPGQVHATFRELLQPPVHLRRKTILMHLDDDLEDFRSTAEDAGFRFSQHLGAAKARISLRCGSADADGWDALRHEGIE